MEGECPGAERHGDNCRGGGRGGGGGKCPRGVVVMIHLRYSAAVEQPLQKAQKEKSFLVESFDDLQACWLRLHECGWRCCENVCLSSFCTSERASGKSIM